MKPKPEIVHLHAALLAACEISVDRVAGIIRNARVSSIGPCLGYDFGLDSQSLAMILALATEQPDGVLSHFKHPKLETDADGNQQLSDSIGSALGRIKNVRLDPAGDCLRGDICFGDYAANLPVEGNVRDYLLDLAVSDPSAWGLSPAMSADYVPTDQFGPGVKSVMRPKALMAIDAVDTPASNPNGLLSAPLNQTKLPAPATPSQVSRLAAGRPGHLTTLGVPMHPHLKGLLTGAGADPGWNDGAMSAFKAKLSPEANTKIDSAHSAYMQANPDAVAATAAGDESDLAAKELPSPGAATQHTVTVTRAHTPVIDVVQLEAKRVSDIKQLGATIGIGSSVVTQCIARNLDAAGSRALMLSELERTNQPIDSVRVGQDNRVQLNAVYADAILLRSNPQGFETAEFKPSEDAKKLAKLDLLGLFRKQLVQLGLPAEEAMDLSRTRLAEMMGPRFLRNHYPQIARLAEGVSDFSNITVDAINKSLRYNYLDAPRTWPRFCQRQTANDFKTINRVVLSEQPSLINIAEGGELKYVVMKDSNQTYALQEYKAGIRLTRRAIINDDKDAFSSLPRSQAAAAARLEEDQVYGAFCGYNPLANGSPTTPLLTDGTAVFTATSTRNNLIASGAGGAPSVLAQLESTENLIMVQLGLAGSAVLDLNAKFILVPTNLKRETQRVLASDRLISALVSTSGSASGFGDANPFKDAFEVISSPRLTFTSTVAWYLFADFRDGQINTMEISFLTDEPEPVVRQQTDFDTEDVLFAVRHTCAAQVIDFRGLAKNYGS